MNKDIIAVKNSEGIEEEVELILTLDKGKKKYIVYSNKDNEIFASYLLDDDKLHNDLTEEEYKMLEELLKKGANSYDK